jgi:hypothetical protein
MSEPLINFRIPVAMIEQKLEGLRARVAGQTADLTAQLVASIALRKVPDAMCRIGKQFRSEAPCKTQERTETAANLGGGAAVSATTFYHRPEAPQPQVVQQNGLKSIPRFTTASHEISDANADAGIASVLSPSQVATWFDCQARWMFGHVLNLPDPGNSKLALGAAVHDALAFNYHQKIDTRSDLPVAEVQANFDIAWSQALEGAKLQKDEKPAEIAGAGRRLVGMYMRDVAPKVQPLAVEKEVSGVIAGVRVRGKVDVIDSNHMVHETKTLSQTPSLSQHMFQLATYGYLCNTTKTRVDALIKTKTPRLVQITHTIDQQDIAGLEKQYPLAQEGMRAGLAMPNRRSMLCTRKNCSFWVACEDEFGGRVRP